MSQKLDNDVLDLVKQKGFYPYEYMNNFEKFKEEKVKKRKSFTVLQPTEKLMANNMNMFLLFIIYLK